LGEKLGENESKILKLIAKDNTVSITVISKKINISTTAIEKNLANLKRKGRLRRNGPAKGGYWELLK
jgi:ATP-dependent DNA helicase RecG